MNRTLQLSPRAFVVVDLGFGDAGKGLVTDYLAREHDARTVVRFNGGAQAGHNVVAPDGRHHTFAQFGSGSFVPGVRTFLSNQVVVDPAALLLEAAALERQGVAGALAGVRVSERARVVTPFHQTANRLRELARGDGRHGSCGVGVGETVRDSLAFPEETIFAGDLLANAAEIASRLQRIRDRKREELAQLREKTRGNEQADREWRIFDEPIAERWLEQIRPFIARELVAPDSLLASWIRDSPATVFEGAQGVLLDETLGFHPHTTFSRCTAANALELLARWAPDVPVTRFGVLRTHAVRHGPGPLPTETSELDGLVREHNRENPWQGTVRRGWFDAVLARHALEVAPVERLVLTHVDLLPRLERFRACVAYRADGEIAPVTRLPRGDGSLHHQSWLGTWLARVQPDFEECDVAEPKALGLIEQSLERRIDVVSRGPMAKDVAEKA